VGWGDRAAVRYTVWGLGIASTLSMAHALDRGGAAAVGATIAWLVALAFADRRSSTRIRVRLGIATLGPLDRRVDDAVRLQIVATVSAALAGLCLGGGKLLAGIVLALVAIGARALVGRFIESLPIRRDERFATAFHAMEGRAIGSFEPMRVVEGMRPVVRSIGNVTYVGSVLLDDLDDKEVRSLVERVRRPKMNTGSWTFLLRVTAGASILGAMNLLLDIKYAGNVGLVVVGGIVFVRQSRAPSATPSRSELRYFESERDLEPAPRYRTEGPTVSLDDYGLSIRAPRRDAIEQVALVLGAVIVAVGYLVVATLTMKPELAEGLGRWFGG